MVLQNRTSGDGNGLGGSNTGTSEIWRMEVVEPSSNFIWRGVCKKEAYLTFDMLPVTVNISELQSEIRAHSR